MRLHASSLSVGVVMIDKTGRISGTLFATATFNVRFGQLIMYKRVWPGVTKSISQHFRREKVHHQIATPPFPSHTQRAMKSLSRHHLPILDPSLSPLFPRRSICLAISPAVRRRTLATTVSPITPPRVRPQTTFTDTLNAGPSLADFLTSSSESIEATEATESLPGSSRLPEWLKRPIPAGGNFARIKKDLRGLNLHTGMNLHL